MAVLASFAVKLMSIKSTPDAPAESGAMAKPIAGFSVFCQGGTLPDAADGCYGIGNTM